jgi:glycosyltransferase involved in cell wall biosynthesis
MTISKRLTKETLLAEVSWREYDFGSSDLQETKDMIQAWTLSRTRRLSTVNWFVPDFYHVYIGGVYTIFRFADFFLRKGVGTRLLLIENPVHTDPSRVKSELASVFPAMKDLEVLILPKEVPSSDISIATRWDTAYWVLKQRNTRAKYYFIQDFEPLFYPAGVKYGLAEATYRFGFIGITNGPHLAEMYRREYGGKAKYFTPCVDKSLFYPDLNASRTSVKRVFFYSRPSIQRNAFELGISALEKIKAAHPDVEVVMAGDDLRGVSIPFQYRDYGLLKLEETARLYRTCDVGMSFTWSRHPSYIPLELMASGCAVISNVNPAFGWILRDGENCLLSEPCPTAIAQAFDKLYENHRLRQAFIEQGLKAVSTSNWEDEMEKIYGYILGQL